jgi:hypothetical protein
LGSEKPNPCIQGLNYPAVTYVLLMLYFILFRLCIETVRERYHIGFLLVRSGEVTLSAVYVMFLQQNEIGNV